MINKPRKYQYIYITQLYCRRKEENRQQTSDVLITDFSRVFMSFIVYNYFSL